MARCVIGPKKVKKIREATGLPVVKALTRGGTDHRIDLCLKGGSVVHLYKDGSTEKSTLKWNEESYENTGKGRTGL